MKNIILLPIFPLVNTINNFKENNTIEIFLKIKFYLILEDVLVFFICLSPYDGTIPAVPLTCGVTKYPI